MEIRPPGAGLSGTIRYGYDQRNLLITSTQYISGTGWVNQAGYVYDGAGDRVQQVDYTGAQPITTTYTNDILGLTQVLLAGDGTNQVANLFGLDLISQDNNPYLNQFQLRDPWNGDPQLPPTLHGYSYGYNNPATYFDPTGQQGEPAGSRTIIT